MKRRFRKHCYMYRPLFSYQHSNLYFNPFENIHLHVHVQKVNSHKHTVHHYTFLITSQDIDMNFRLFKVYYSCIANLQFDS